MTHKIRKTVDNFKKLLLSSIFIGLALITNNIYAQTIDSTLTKDSLIVVPIDSSFIKAKKDSLQQIQSQLKSLQKQEAQFKSELQQIEKSIKSYPIWKKGIFGTIGFNVSRFENWLSKNQSNTNAITIAYAVNTFITLEEKKYYWNNRINLAHSWLKFDDKNRDDDEEGFQVASDNFNFNSLFGYKFSNVLAASALLEYRTGILETRFNNPGNLDYGVGMSWTGVKNLVVSIHPINYNVVFSDVNLTSSLGLKALANYSAKFSHGISWVSSFSGFRSYKDKALNNWVWNNTLNKSFKHLGIGFDLAFKQSAQEAIARNLDDSPFQWYYVFGLSYNY